MPTTKAISQPTSEPVDLALFKAHLRLPADDTSEDMYCLHCLSAARGKAENHCNQYFTNRTVETTFEVTEPYVLPPGAGPVTQVTGFITTVAELPQVGQRWAEYVKGITVSRDYPIDYENLPTYTVRYTLTAAPEPDVLQAIMKIAADMYENRENSTTGTANRFLSLNFQLLLAPYRVIN